MIYVTLLLFTKEPNKHENEEKSMDNSSEKQIFREKSIDRISSPEDLNDYVRVASPGVWLTLAAIIILLVGFLIWGVVGEIQSTIPAVIISDEGVIVCFVSESKVDSIREGMTVELNDGRTCTVTKIGRESLDSHEIMTDYARHLANFSDGEWVHPVFVDGEFGEGVWGAKVIADAIHPITFILN